MHQATEIAFDFSETVRIKKEGVKLSKSISIVMAIALFSALPLSAFAQYGQVVPPPVTSPNASLSGSPATGNTQTTPPQPANNAPILNLSPEKPSQWQSPLTQQSSPSLPPVPVTQASASSNAAQSSQSGKPAIKKATTASGKAAKSQQPLNLKEPQSEPMAGMSANSALSIGASSQRIPAGTYLNVRFNTALDSKTTEAGLPFTATLLEDFNANQRVVLPAGTLVRGRVEEVKKPTFFSKGGAIYLTFDHVVLPTGDLMPLDLKLSTENSKVNKSGAVYQDPGIQKKLGQSVHKGAGVFQNITKSGVQAGKETADGLGTIVMVPLAVVGGALAGTAVTAGNSAVAIVGRGESAMITPGDTVRIDFGGSFNLPTE